MELSKLDAAAASIEGRTLTLRDPRALRGDSEVDKRPFLLADDNNPAAGHCTLNLLGPDSPAVKRLMDPQRARYMSQALVSQSRRGVTFTAEDIEAEEEENLSIAIAATTGWSGFTMNGEVLEYSPHNARLLYVSSRDILEQALAFIRERANFLQGSKTK